MEACGLYLNDITKEKLQVRLKYCNFGYILKVEEKYVFYSISLMVGRSY